MNCRVGDRGAGSRDILISGDSVGVKTNGGRQNDRTNGGSVIGVGWWRDTNRVGRTGEIVESTKTEIAGETRKDQIGKFKVARRGALGDSKDSGSVDLDSGRRRGIAKDGGLIVADKSGDGGGRRRLDSLSRCQKNEKK